MKTSTLPKEGISLAPSRTEDMLSESLVITSTRLTIFPSVVMIRFRHLLEAPQRSRDEIHKTESVE